MPDIALCRATACKKYSKCYRAQAKPDSLWQTYLDPNLLGEDCTLFWPMKKDKKPITIKKKGK